MAYPQPKTITSWSFSRYNVYKLCPYKAKLMFIEKRKEPPNEAMARGDAIHKLAEKYIKGEILRCPPELKLFKDEFTKLRKLFKSKLQAMVVEDSWNFREDWSETVWNDWVGCWLRIKLDCAHQENADELDLTDWKTGKFRAEKNEEYVEQLELYALTALVMKPHIKRVYPRLCYLDLGITYPEKRGDLVFTQEDVPRLKKLWLARTKKMLTDKKFAPRPNNLCSYCFFSAKNKGPCKY